MDISILILYNNKYEHMYNNIDDKETNYMKSI